MSGSSPEVLGILLDRVPGIEPTYLPMRSGLTVLYGLNGAGKTRILEAIQSVWQGLDGGAQLLVRLPIWVTSEPDEDDSEGYPFTHVSRLQQAIAQAWLPSDRMDPGAFPSEEDAEQAYQEIVNDALDEDWFLHTDPYTGELDPQRWHKIVEEVLERRLVLIAGGARDGAAPKWVVTPVALGDVDATASTLELQRVRDHLDLVDQDHPAAYVEPHETADGQLSSTIGLDVIDAGEGDLEVPLMGTFRRVDRTPFRLVWPGLDLLLMDEDPSGETKRAIAEGFQLTFTGSRLLASDATRLGDEPSARAADLEQRANRRLQSVLLDPPDLELRVRPVAEWWDQEPLVWQTRQLELPLTSLSRAELRWTRWAIGQAIHDHRYGHEGILPPTLLLIDEPEAALHRSAEAHMARTLAKLAEEPRRHVIVASHSPELLNLDDARVVHVRKRSGSTSSLHELNGTDQEVLAELGLNPSDLLRRQRGFLLVEGQHDEVVLRTLLGSELDLLRVDILPLRGARKLPGTIESRLLFDFTDAHLFVLLDNLPIAAISDIWLGAQARHLAGEPEVAGEELRAALGTSSREREWLSQWLSRALERNRAARITPLGLTRRDIIEYLPTERLVPGAHDWRSLREEHASACEAGAPQKDFKKWLIAVKKAQLSRDAIASAAARASGVPAELEWVMAQIRRGLGQRS